MDLLTANSTLWDIIEFKFIVLFITVVLAVLVGNWLYDQNKKK